MTTTIPQDAPNLSDLPPLNQFAVQEAFRSSHPLAQVADLIHAEDDVATYARIDLELPLGCPFSLFVVRGYPLDEEELPCLVASLVICRELAEALAANLRDATILELPVQPPVRKREADET